MANDAVTERTGTTVRRSSKLEAILDAGARRMNALGAGSIVLGDLAQELGLSRNALYYYVKDRSDLVRLCYERACQKMQSDLQSAIVQEICPKEQIRVFVERSLSIDSAAYAVVSDQDLLKEPARTAISVRLNKNIDALSGIFRAGQSSSVFKLTDPEIAAQTLFGMLSWTQLWYNWSLPENGARALRLATAADSICDAIFYGVAADSGAPFECGVDAQQLTFRRFNTFDRDEANAQRQSLLVDAASLLFNRRGLEGASIDDVGSEVGATKGAVYHHFKDKNAFIVACYERAFEQYELFAKCALESRRPPLDQLLMVLHLNCQAQAGETPPLILQPGLQSLPDQFLQRARALASQMRALHAAGMKQGGVRPTSPAIVELPAGAFFWIPKWRAGRPDLSASTIADEMTRIYRSGLCSRDGAALKTAIGRRDLD